MIKNSLKKKVFLIISSLFIIFILYLFPIKASTQKKKETTYKNNESIIYLLDNNNYVARVEVVTSEKEKIKKAKEIINYLTINTTKSSHIKEGFKPIIPENTKVLDISVNDDLIKINFTKDFLKVNEKNEKQMLSSIIYSLTSIEGINKISIYIEGNILNKLPNSKEYLDPVLDRQYGINQIYNITSFKGTNNTTIYYLSKYKDYYYYVPVSVVNNDKKDKIEIIVEEFTSKTVYQTNLISYLNDAKQMSYEVTDDYILFNFSKSLYNDLNSNNLLESVVYAINLTIKDNYDIKKVIYKVDNNLYKYCEI